jgi:hypothetical protein
MMLQIIFSTFLFVKKNKMTRRVKTVVGISISVFICLSIGGLSGYITQAAGFGQKEVIIDG